MGSELVNVQVGAEKLTFSVHKNLICNAGDHFMTMFTTPLKPNQIVSLSKAHPDAFKLFIDYLYSKRIPAVTRAMVLVKQGARLRELCQLYSFLESYDAKVIIRNKVMDAIQDGFAIMNKFPQYHLIKGIYSNTGPGSPLRSFCMACIIFPICHPDLKADESLRDLLKEHDQFFDHFITSLPALVNNKKDPRVRSCGGDEKCTECDGRDPPEDGMWPCTFHIHGSVTDGSDAGVQLKSESGVSLGRIHGSEKCYMWYE